MSTFVWMWWCVCCCRIRSIALSLLPPTLVVQLHFSVLNSGLFFIVEEQHASRQFCLFCRPPKAITRSWSWLFSYPIPQDPPILLFSSSSQPQRHLIAFLFQIIYLCSSSNSFILQRYQYEFLIIRRSQVVPKQVQGGILPPAGMERK